MTKFHDQTETHHALRCLYEKTECHELNLQEVNDDGSVFLDLANEFDLRPHLINRVVLLKRIAQKKYVWGTTQLPVVLVDAEKGKCALLVSSGASLCETVF